MRLQGIDTKREAGSRSSPAGPVPDSADGGWHGRFLSGHVFRDVEHVRLKGGHATQRLVFLGCFGASIGLFRLNLALAQQDPPRPPPSQADPKGNRDENGGAVDKKAEELGKRLLHKAVSESDEDLMDSTVRLMSESERKLEIDFDPGEETQKVQATILDKLNDAIKAAGKRRMSRGGQASSSSDRRRADTSSKPQPPPGGKLKPPGTGSADAESTTTPTDSGDAKPARGDFQETRRSWGLLPQRERDEMIQGSSEAFIERYREWIERYYRALQESGE